MDDDALFTNFATNTLNITPARARNELLLVIPTFRQLMNTSESDLDTFVKDIHSANSGRAAAERITYRLIQIYNLKALRFELQDRNRCNELPDHATLADIDANQLSILRTIRSENIETTTSKGDLPEITVPKFTSVNYEDFIQKFETVVSRAIGAHDVSIDYLLRETNGVYNYAWPSRKEKLRNCLALEGPYFNEDSKTLYQLYLQYIGTEGIGSNIVTKYKTSKNGYLLHKDFKRHFANDTYLQNKATAAASVLRTLVYKGDRTHFKIEDYYTRITQCFNYMQAGGPNHTLNEHQKVQQFESGLKESDAARYHVDAKAEWLRLPDTRTFDDYYNLFSAKLAQYRTIMNLGNESNYNNYQIRQVTSSGRGRGRGRVGGRFGGFYATGRRGGRGGRGRGGRYNFRRKTNPY